MVSPELLRRYKFFGLLEDAQLKVAAMLAEEVTCPPGTVLFQQDTATPAVYVLLEGDVDLFCRLGEARQPQEVLVGEINAGEVFGLSALIEPYQGVASARAVAASRLLKFEAPRLRAACAADNRLANGLLAAVAKTALERLYSTRIQLAAARA